ncbi:efflux RND transporter periplasmic adaptor subunit [Bacteroidota bacterium]
MSKKSILLLSLTFLVIFIAGFLSFKKLSIFAPPSVKRSDFRATVVDFGTVLTTVEAEGVVVPESEVLLLSPASSIIDKILQAPGSRVNAFQTILRLDTKPLEEEIARLEDQIGIKRNSLQRTKLNAKSTRVDLDYQVEMKKLRIASLKSDLVDQAELLEVGGISPAKFEKTKQELTLANKELEMIQSKNSIRLQQLQVEERGLELQIDIQEKELESKKENLSKTSVRAPSAGIIMSINGKEGEMVSKDKLLVRLSDLSSFKIIGSVGDEHAELVKTGNTVFAILDGKKLTGQIGTVYPEVQGNKIKFDAFLEESNYPKLISNMNLQLLIVRRKKENVLRLENGSVPERGRNIELYVVEKNQLLRRAVTVGLRGSDYIEIRSGLQAGEEVVVSETDEFRNRPEIDISN